MLYPKPYRRIYVTEPRGEFEALRPYTNDIRFVTTGRKQYVDVFDEAKFALQDFDPEQDAIVAIGRSLAALAIGVILAGRCNTKIVIGIFRDGAYSFSEVEF